jgi:hypothetical protein
MADPKVLGFVASFLDEVLPTVVQAPGEKSNSVTAPSSPSLYCKAPASLSGAG